MTAAWNSCRNRKTRRAPYRLRLEPLESRFLLATFRVNSTGDEADLNPGNGICEISAGGACTLRAAIQEANASANVGGPDEIQFGVPGSGPHTISPNSALPTILQPVIIDGYTQGSATPDPLDDAVPNTNRVGQGLNTVLKIELNGANAGTGINGLNIGAGGSTVRGLAVSGFRRSGTINGIGIVLTAGTGNSVVGNFIGTGIDGVTDLGNEQAGVLADSSGNTVGGMTPDARNLISGNELAGVRISFGSGNVVVGNLIGTDRSGTVRLGNDDDGVTVASSGNTIGGTSIGARNVISGNAFGIYLAGSGNLVRGNLIGTDVTGAADLGNTFDGVLISSSGNTIGGTSAAARNVISGNASNGMEISGAGATGNLVQGNFIGTDVNGSADLGNMFIGVYLNNAPDNTVGGTAAGARNIVSGNGFDGVRLALSGATRNLVQGNFIGTNSAGNTDLGNAGHGIAIIDAPGNSIGGTTALARNVISGNERSGVGIFESGATGNLVQGNFIGTNATSTMGLGNTSGMSIVAAPGNTVGGTTTGAGNVISGNDLDGVGIFNSPASGNVVQGNFIGTGSGGTTDFGNGGSGVFLNGSPSNTIGGTTAGAGNLIGFNNLNGVHIAGADAQGNIIQGNLIGTNPAAPVPNIGNAGHGVLAIGSGPNQVGGTVPGAGNTIAFNGGDGVAVVFVEPTSFFKFIRRNSIFMNAGLGIDLGDDGITLNDPGDTDTGANGLFNFPILQSALNSGSNLIVSGFARPGTEIELFIADPDPTGFGEGKTFLTTVIEGSAADTDSGMGSYPPPAGQGTDTTNRFRFVIPFSSLPTVLAAGTALTATGTDANTNTSEFSGNIPVSAACSLLVTTTSDVVNDTDAVSSLREAILCANLTPGTDTINVPAGTYTLTIGGSGEDAAATGDLDITDDLVLNGAGAALTIIEACAIAAPATSCTGIDRVFHVLDPTEGRAGPVDATFSGLIVRHGFVSGTDDGGGINAQANGIVDVTNSVITNNAAGGTGGGIFNGFTGFSILGVVRVTETSISDNLAGSDGGGIANRGASVFITRSTISSNVAANNGGGIWNHGFLRVTNSTISGNSGRQGGGTFHAFGVGAELFFTTHFNNTATNGSNIFNNFSPNSVVVSNSIIAGGAEGANCAGLAIQSFGFNLDNGTSCGFASASDLTGVDPLLGPLTFNGGPTQTHALGSGSPAINAGNSAAADGLGLTTDQRGVGFPRIRGGIVDIGAFEAASQTQCANAALDSREIATEGNVKARVSGGLLRVRGDALGNGLVIEAGDGPDSYRISPLGGTTINRQFGTVEFFGTRGGIQLGLLGGPDVLVLDGTSAELVVSGKLRIRSGTSSTAIIDRALSLFDDHDIVAIVDALLESGLTVKLHRGADDLTLCGVEALDRVRTGEGLGPDTLTIDDSSFSDRFNAGTGVGQDLVTIEQHGNVDGLTTEFNGRTKLRTRKGNDAICIGNAGEPGNSANFRGRTKIRGGRGRHDSLDGLDNGANTFDTPPVIVGIEQVDAGNPACGLE